MLTMALFLIGIVSGVLIGGRLKNAQIFGAGFVAGGVAGLAVAGKIAWEVLYGKRGGGNTLSNWLRGENRPSIGQERKALLPVLQVQRANIYPGRKRNGDDPGKGDRGRKA